MTIASSQNAIFAWKASDGFGQVSAGASLLARCSLSRLKSHQDTQHRAVAWRELLLFPLAWIIQQRKHSASCITTWKLTPKKNIYNPSHFKEINALTQPTSSPCKSQVQHRGADKFLARQQHCFQQQGNLMRVRQSGSKRAELQSSVHCMWYHHQIINRGPIKTLHPLPEVAYFCADESGQGTDPAAKQIKIKKKKKTLVH